MQTKTVFIVATAALLLVPGCLQGILGDARTEWAYSQSQLNVLADMGLEGKGVTVAILDTGINTQHPALEHLVDGQRGNGELIGFFDFLGDASGPEEAFDDDGHGSHVAGIISARGGSGGVGGIKLLGGAPSVLLLVARVCAGDACGGSVIDDAVRWAVAQGADVISMSLGGDAGGGIFGLTSSDVEAAINNAIDRGVVVVASAGNDGPDNDDVNSPSSIPGVISVGATTRGGKVASFSSRGDDASNPCRSTPVPVPGVSSRCEPHQKPEIVAPGDDILSAGKGDSYATAKGTSQATPFVTAAVALLVEGRSLTSRADVYRVKQVLVDSAEPIPGQILPHDEGAGYGILQARDAYKAYTGK